jgi:UDPglucose 6-dehydrogenase
VIAVWGIAFKAGTDDMRDAPSRILITDLLTAGATVRAFDPAAGVGAKALYEMEHDVTIVGSAAEALQGADALAIAADWPEFREVSPDTILAALSEPLVVDGRNLFDPVRMREAGITYCGVGRGDA